MILLKNVLKYVKLDLEIFEWLSPTVKWFLYICIICILGGIVFPCDVGKYNFFYNSRRKPRRTSLKIAFSKWTCAISLYFLLKDVLKQKYSDAK